MDVPERQIKQIVIQRMDRCRVCHRLYGTEDVQVISRSQEMWMMVVECTDCHARNFVAAVLNEGDPAQAELALKRLSDNQPVIESGPEEMEPFVVQIPVKSEDVADMHAFLRDFNGDFASLFRT
jgi:hypothetical protein